MMHITRNLKNLKGINFKPNFFKNSFFPSAISEWNKCNLQIYDSDIFESFKKQTLHYIRPCQNSNFKLSMPLGIKLNHNDKYNFQDSIDPLCCWIKFDNLLNVRMFFNSSYCLLSISPTAWASNCCTIWLILNAAMYTKRWVEY